MPSCEMRPYMRLTHLIPDRILFSGKLIYLLADFSQFVKYDSDAEMILFEQVEINPMWKLGTVKKTHLKYSFGLESLA